MTNNSEIIQYPIVQYGHYPLKLLNTDNSCYSNVILQVILHLGQHFHDLVQIDTTPNTNKKPNFRFVYINFYSKMYKNFNVNLIFVLI